MMDTSELLRSKENIQPLRNGRDTSLLNSGLQAETDSDAKLQLLKKRQEFEVLLRDETVDDPMAVWFDYINWIEQCFPSQSQQSKINVVLKKCINKFKDSIYKNDERFVKLCLKYAFLNIDTLETFCLLYGNGIGDRCASFYIAWAEAYAVADSFKKADLVYQKGINKLAEPIEVLKEAHKHFQAFLVRKMLNNAEMFQPTSEILGNGQTRQAYNKLQPSLGNAVPNIRVGEHVAAPGKFHIPSSIQKSNTGIKIYEDSENQDALLDAKNAGKMHKLKSHSSITKENHKKPGVWTNKDSRHAQFSVQATPLSFPVHVDEYDEDQRIKTNILSSALKPKDVHDEFNVDFSKVPLFIEEPYDPTKRPMYCKHLIYAGGSEVQLEQLKAIRYFRRMAELDKVMKEVPTSTQKEAENEPEPSAAKVSVVKESFDGPRKSLKVRPSDEARSARRKIAMESRSSSARKTISSCFSGVVRRPGEEDEGNKPLGVSSESFNNQTINTKEALNEMQEFWFAKTATPPASDLKVYVDESTLHDNDKQPKSNKGTRRTLAYIPERSVETVKASRKTLACIPEHAATTPHVPSSEPEQAYNEFNVDFTKIPMFIPEPHDSTKKPMYPKHLVYDNGVEFQLEQLRARKYIQRKPTSCLVSRSTKPTVVEQSQQKSTSSNFGTVSRKLDLDDNATSNLSKTGVPSEESFVNQTINTKEAVVEMKELWFAKPATPARKRTDFNFFVDESCFEDNPEAHRPTSEGPRRVLSVIPLSPAEAPVAPVSACLPDDEPNKENMAPLNYPGPFGKSTRPTSGVLTLATNVHFQPVIEDEEDEEEENGNEYEYDVPGNMTGITETWNFTQAFQIPRIPHASTPNTRQIQSRADINNVSVGVPVEQEEEPLNLKTPVQIPRTPEMEEGNGDVEQAMHQRVLTFEQRNFPEHCTKNLSIIVETSREYKSSSSGGSTCSKVLPGGTFGESRFEGYSKRCQSYSQTEKTPSSKTPSRWGCTETSEEIIRTAGCIETDRLQAVPEQDEASSLQAQFNVECDKLSEGMKVILLEPSSVEEDIDPFCNKLTDSFLEKINFPLKHHAEGCQFLYTNLPLVKVNSSISCGNKSYDVKKLLGEGAYAKVYKVLDSSTGQYKVMKYQKPAFPWEFYIAREIRARCSQYHVYQFMHIEEAYFYDNASLFVTYAAEYGDLCAVINQYRAREGRPMSDYLAIYFSVQILQIIQALHAVQIIHGDIKPDNFLVKKINGELKLELIDFGRSIDMTLFPKGTQFSRVVTTENFTCIEMKTNRPWTYQIDLYGVAACIHCLLFGDYMNVMLKNNLWSITKTIPRYLAKSGWKDIFEKLLNIPSSSEMPDLAELRSNLNVKLEAYGTHADLHKLKNILENR